MPTQHFRHYRVAKREQCQPETCLTSCCDYMSFYFNYLKQNPLIFFGVILFLLVLLKHIFCPHH